MDRTYVAQSLVVVIFYIAIIALLAYFDPRSESLTCDRSFTCTVHQNTLLYFHTEGTFNIGSHTKLLFYPVTRRNNSYRVSLGTTYEPFRGYIHANSADIMAIKDDFSRYQQGLNDTFSLKTNQRNHSYWIIGSILTFIVIVILMNDKPLTILGRFIVALLTRGRY